MFSKPKKMFKLTLKSVSLCILLVAPIIAGGIGIYLYFVISSLPEVTSLKTYQHSHATEVYSDEGRKIGEFTTERRYPVKFESIPKHVLQAFVAAEDAHFYEHSGIDYNGILRAIYSNLARGKFAQGGSTITQQVARAIVLETKKKEITRKVREMVLAHRMEQQLSKSEILNLYLQEIYLGHGAYGIGAAARNYFNKKVEDLDVAEGALLAGLPQRPNDWNPFHNPDRAKSRQAYVLKRMQEENFITAKVAEKALAEPIRLYPLEEFNNSAAPYFTEYVRQYLMSKYGSENVLSSGYIVHTTVRYEAQKAAEKSVEDGLRDVDKRLGWRGVLQNLQGEKADAFLKEVHDNVIAELNPPRILPLAALNGMKILEYDLSLLKQGAYFGNTPVAEGKYYKALVKEVSDAKANATIRIGQTTAVLPLSTMNWVKVDGASLKAISQVLKAGDYIYVRVDKIDRRSNYIAVSLEQEPEVQGALLSYDVQTGFVRAMVGGRDFNRSKFNCALQAKRQVGSTFKPLIYAAAVDKGYSPSSMVTDSPLVFKYEGKLDADASPSSASEDWKPHNYGNKYIGDVPLRLALIRSMNIPTVKVLNEIGIDYGIQYARQLGITSSLPRDLTIGLGSWSSSLEELMRAYSIFPRYGKPIGLVYIKKIVDEQGNILEEWKEPVPVPKVEGPVKNETQSASASPTPSPGLEDGRVISEQTAYVITDMLKGVIGDREGTGHAAGINFPVAGKTGTSNDHRDAWFVGYSPQVVTGVWVGYEKDKPLDPSETGGKASAPIWANYMKSVLPGYPAGDFRVPDDVVFAYVDRHTGRVTGSANPQRVKVAFKLGTVPNENGDNIKQIGEPGVRATAAGKEEASPFQPADTPTENDTETSDFMRQGYQ